MGKPSYMRDAYHVVDAGRRRSSTHSLAEYIEMHVRITEAMVHKRGMHRPRPRRGEERSGGGERDRPMLSRHRVRHPPKIPFTATPGGFRTGVRLRGYDEARPRGTRDVHGDRERQGGQHAKAQRRGDIGQASR